MVGLSCSGGSGGRMESGEVISARHVPWPGHARLLYTAAQPRRPLETRRSWTAASWQPGSNRPHRVESRGHAPRLETTCIDSMQAFFVRAGCRVSTSTAVKSIGSRTRSGSAAVTRAIEARQRGQAPSKRTRKAG